MEVPPNRLGPARSLGTVRLHREGTHEPVLIPQPSNDPNDPLNWPKPYRYYLASITSATLFFANFLTIGPSITLLEVAVDFFGVTIPSPSDAASLTSSNMSAFQHAISQASYFYSCSALMHGISNLFWMPLAVKYGRRPVYLASFGLFFIAAVWAGMAKSFASELAARILMGLGSGSAECVAPLTISDIFFLHERGRVMSFYTIALSAGGGAGSVVAGLISLRRDWRVMYYITSGFIGLLIILIGVSMPETVFQRVPEGRPSDHLEQLKVKTTPSANHIEDLQRPPTKKRWKQNLSLWGPRLTNEPLWLLFIRPVGMLLVPPILWATLVLGLNVGFTVVISTSVASSLADVYSFDTWQIGLFWLSNLIGAVLGVPAAGALSDHVANRLTQANDGIREPEMRLPTMVIGMVLMPISMLTYGLGLHYRLHWMVPAVGLGIFGFGLVVTGNITIVYSIDAYRPIAGEVVVTQMGFKAAFAFLLGFYVNPWIAAAGYAGTFGTMAGITFVVYAMWIPLYLWGAKLRHASMGWKVMGLVGWHDDREVGE